MLRVLIVGAGDVARRVVPLLAGHCRLFALVRRSEACADWRQLGVIPVLADLDDRRTLFRVAGLADVVVYLAPPAAEGVDDARVRRFIAALQSRRSLSQRLVYLSTSGVYGDCQGALVTECTVPVPQTDRGRRRLAAERRFRHAASPSGWRVCIVRVPGIYAADRLPIERVRRQLPVLAAPHDGATNHIHADDLARVLVAALWRGAPNRVYHAVDQSRQTMGEYLDQVADHAGLPRPPRAEPDEVARRVGPAMWSYLAESRVLSNQRMTQELRVHLRYPTVAEGLAAAREGPERHRSLCPKNGA